MNLWFLLMCGFSFQVLQFPRQQYVVPEPTYRRKKLAIPISAFFFSPCSKCILFFPPPRKNKLFLFLPQPAMASEPPPKSFFLASVPPLSIKPVSVTNCPSHPTSKGPYPAIQQYEVNGNLYKNKSFSLSVNFGELLIDVFCNGGRQNWYFVGWRPWS